MGFMDNFTSDSPVTVKQPDYYEMVKEAFTGPCRVVNCSRGKPPGIRRQQYKRLDRNNQHCKNRRWKNQKCNFCKKHYGHCRERVGMD